MNDRRFTHFIFAVMALLLLWWFVMRRRAVPTPQQITMAYDPEIITYASDPGKFGPINVNVSADASINGLNPNYMPLFGFVGMAQGELWNQ